MRRLAVVAAALAPFALPSTAHAWTWPAPGDVLAPFVLGGDPYAGGQHRGIDVEGEKDGVVLAPASGAVAFAGSVGANGKVVTIETDGGYSVTLVHLGALSVGKGDALSEGAPVGTIGPSGARRARCPVRSPGYPRHERSAGLRRPAQAAAASGSAPAAAPAEPCSTTRRRAGPTTTGARRPCSAAVPRAARTATGRGSGTGQRGCTSVAGGACHSPRARARARVRGTSGHCGRGGSPPAGTRGGRSTADPLVARQWSPWAPGPPISEPRAERSARALPTPLVSAETFEAGQTRASASAYVPSQLLTSARPGETAPGDMNAHGEAPTVLPATTPVREVDRSCHLAIRGGRDRRSSGRGRNSRSARPRTRRPPSDGPYTLSTCAST